MILPFLQRDTGPAQLPLRCGGIVVSCLSMQYRGDATEKEDNDTKEKAWLGAKAT